MDYTDIKKVEFAKKIYLYLGAIFITSLFVSNLIFQKFFFWHPFELEIFGFKLFELSVGILPYPITFLVTDLISEIYGKKKANEVVIAGIFASFFSLSIIYIANEVPAMDGSPVNNETFTEVFYLSGVAVLSSMLAYLFAQFIDIRIYHFWKKKTKGRLLWLRNNFSTFTSQFVDTFTIVSLLIVFEILPQDKFLVLIVSGFLFKVMVAVLDTPLLYIFVWLFRRKFNLKVGEEIKLN